MTELTEFEKRVFGCLMIMLGWQIAKIGSDMINNHDYCAIFMTSLSILFSSMGFMFIENSLDTIKVEIKTKNKRWVYE